MTRKDWLDNATRELTTAEISSARLDSEILLTHALNIPRTTLHAHPEEALPDALVPVLDAMLSLRIIRVPLAYIIGHRDFYGRLFTVTPSVLIPRPETEDIVTLVGELPSFASLIDVGTGSGALAVTLALEHPGTSVTATDISRRALAVARTNSDTYQAGVTFVETDLIAGLPAPGGPTCIVANLPYVAATDPRSPETVHEPDEALFAGNDGLDDIFRLVIDAQAFLESGDYLLLESNPSQQPMIIRHANDNGFALEQTRHLITVFRRN